MAFGSTDLKKILTDNKILSPDDLDRLEKEAVEKKQALGNYIVAKKIVTEDKLAKLFSDFLGVPLVDLTEIKIPEEVLKIIPEPIARRHRVIAFKKKGDELDLAMLDPEDLQTREFAKITTGFVI